MSSVNWNDKSLSDLKRIVSQIDGGMFAQLEHSAQQYRDTSSVLEQTSYDLSNQSNELGMAWMGKAADAANDDAMSNVMTTNDTRSSSVSSSSFTDDYVSRLRRDHQEASQIKNVDTSFGHAMASGGWAGPVGVGAKMLEAHQQYNDHHDQMVKIVQQMDQDGDDHADFMRNTYWPTGSQDVSPPPRSLPPVPGAADRSGDRDLVNYFNSNHSGGTGGYTSSTAGPAMNGDDNEVINGGGHHHPTSTVTNPTQTQTGPTSTVPGDPTITQGGPGSVTTPGTGGPGGTIGSAPGTGGVNGAGAVGGVLGGAGLLGAGAAGGRGLLGGSGTRDGVLGEGEGEGAGRGRSGSGFAEGEEEPRLGGSRAGAIGEGEGEPRLGGPRGGALAEGEEPRLGARGTGGFAEEGDPALRGSTRGGVPDEELGRPRGGMLEEGRPVGFGGEPVAGEAGRLGYPAGGGGRRGNSDDEESPMPDYLVETDGVWGDGLSAAPPVIGE